MTELREIGRQIADAAINAGMAVMVSDFEKHSRLSNKVESLLSELETRDAAIGDSGRVTVDRARFERIWNVAVAAHEELSEEAGYGGSGTTGTCAAVEWLQPGDLEPLG